MPDLLTLHFGAIKNLLKSLAVTPDLAFGHFDVGSMESAENLAVQNAALSSHKTMRVFHGHPEIQTVLL